MKTKWKIILAILAGLVALVVWFINHPVDIRPKSLKNGIIQEQYTQGQKLMNEVQEAYGGKKHWLSFGTGSYAQVADWYDDPLGRSGWDELQQQFEMTSVLGTDDSELKLLNGINQGQRWGVENWESYKMIDGKKEFQHNEKYHHKLIYKNYWFQFPYRISEAPIIAYGDKSTINGIQYDILFTTWGSEKANWQFDQYVMYVHPKTRLIEWLNFTLREKIKIINITAHFTDFQKINGITLPYSQYITLGGPHSNVKKMHENRYQWIQFGDQKVY